MKKIILIKLLVLCSSFAFAQDCTTASLDELTGAWRPGDKGAISLSATDLVKAKSITPVADNMMRSGFQLPKGLSATYFSAYSGYDKINGNGLALYDYSIGLHNFMCYNKRIIVDPHALIKLRITFNDPGVSFGRDVVPGNWEDDEKDYFDWIDNFPQQKNGIAYIKSTPDSAQFTYKPERWLITYDGKLPFAYVTRLEYLQRFKEKLTKNYRRDIGRSKNDNPIRPKAEQEKEKEDALKKIKDEAANGKGDWTNVFMRNYRTDEQKQEASIKITTDVYNKNLQIVEGLLKAPQKDLQQTAIVQWNSEFPGFLNEGDLGARIVVKANPDYYDKKLSKAVPQVIFISLARYDGGKKANYNAAYNEIIKRLDLQKLQAMLGK